MNEEMKNIYQEFQKGYNRLKNELFPKFCFYDDKCNNKISKAHSVQKNRILTSISENGMVLNFQPDPTNIDMFFKALPIGIKKASTFKGFCNYHDNNLFTAIENSEYQLGNKEQQYLFAYRNLAFEYHAKKYQLLYNNKVYNACLECDKEFLKTYLTIEANYVSEYINNNIDEHKYRIQESLDVLEQLDNQRYAFNLNLDKNRFYKVKTYEIVFDKRYEIAASGLPTIVYDINGNRINDIHKLKSHLAFLFVTIFPTMNKTVVLLSCSQMDYSRYENFFKQIENLSIENIKKVISCLLVGYIENLFLSPRLWNDLSDSEKSTIEATYTNNIGRYDRELLSDLSFNLFI